MGEDKVAGSISWQAIISVALGGVLTIVGGVVGSYFTFLNTSRDLDIKMIELSLSILSGEKGGADDPQKDFSYVQARLFALRTLDKYSGVDIPDADMMPWAQGGRIPTAPILSMSPFGIPWGSNPYTASKVGVVPVGQPPNVPPGYQARIDGDKIVATSPVSSETLSLWNLVPSDCSTPLRLAYLASITSADQVKAWRSRNCNKPATDRITAPSP